jgi:hypothetical protein
MNGPNAVYTVTMASAGTLTSELKLQRSYKTMFIEIASMTSNSQIHIHAATVTGGTFRKVYFPLANSASPVGNVFTINSAVSNGIVPIPNGIQFLKVETTATVDNGCTFKIICSD